MSALSIQGLLNSLSTFPVFSYLFGFTKDFTISLLKTGPIPKHVALIMDGNRRYAKNHNLALKDGHSAGAETLLKVLDICFKVGVNVITIYAFSIENFNRAPEEIDTLFGLLRDKLRLLSESDTSYTTINKIRVRIVGNKSLIPADILADLEVIEEKTNTPTSVRILNVCFPYTSRDEIVHSIRAIADRYKQHEIVADDITTKLIEDYMYMGPESPPLDILIRTSGHTRLSDFMLWQCTENCTIEFVDTLWPDFKFLSIMKILLKWSYKKTIQLEEEAVLGKEPPLPDLPNSFKQLPPPPPIVSVSERK